MTLRIYLLAALLIASAAVPIQAADLPRLEAIARRIPPPGMDIPAAEAERLRERLAALDAKLSPFREHSLHADVAVLLKAVRFALDHGEFYRPGDDKKAESLLEEAARRVDALAQGQSPWADQRGLVVRGFTSAVDASPQPYGMHIPAELDLERPQPLIVWLHGRGDANTDMHFIADRMRKVGEVAPPWALVVHPFGRQCIGFKSAGETDVLEAIAHVRSQYPIDKNRIVLMGFSMGGAGAWHLGAHYTEKWAAVSPGAGFAETARYQKLKPANYPPNYEQTLWGVYDVPAYVRNLFNTDVVAYSGELDKQIQAARVMEEAFAAEGRELTHLIGPGMGHKYHAGVLADILDRMRKAAIEGRPELPRTVHLQTRTLRYHRMHWVAALRLEQHWRDSRIDAVLHDDDSVEITTRNIAALRLTPWREAGGKRITIDGQALTATAKADDRGAGVTLAKRGGKWSEAEGGAAGLTIGSQLAKKPGLQGPIDDAFMEPFLVVLPTSEAAHERVGQWVEFEAAHQQRRWRELFRGDMRVKRDTEVTADDLQRYHLVLWGDPASNRLIREFLDDDRQPLRWDREQLTLGGKSYASSTHMPVLIFPNPSNPQRYVVLNSGPTFREAHDRTNSLQNPKLPDWAVLDITTAPSTEAAGRVVSADFFNEQWK